MAVPLGGTVAAVTMPGLERFGGVGLALGLAAVAVAITGLLFAYVAADRRRPSAARVHQPLRSIWRTPGMQRLLAVAAFYIVVLQAVLAFTVPAARAAGLTAFAASATFFAVNVSAMVSRIAWGHVADRAGGSRRVRTLVEVGIVAAVGALLFTLALHAGVAVVIPAAVLFGFGALGWNALVYVSAGERAAPELAARSVAVAATVVFLISAVSTPLLGALASQAGWDVFWIVTAVLAARRCSRRRDPSGGGCALTRWASTATACLGIESWSHETDGCMFAACGVRLDASRPSHATGRASVGSP